MLTNPNLWHTSAGVDNIFAVLRMHDVPLVPHVSLCVGDDLGQTMWICLGALQICHHRLIVVEVQESSQLFEGVHSDVGVLDVEDFQSINSSTPNG